MRMRRCPGLRLTSALKITIDNDCFTLCGRAAGTSRGGALDNCGTGIDRDQLFIRQHDFTAVRDLLRIDRAMTVVKKRAGSSDSFF
jgi:hypothetical protein